MAVNKVNFGGQTLIDTSEDTATASDVRSGATFHSASGQMLTGSATILTLDDIYPVGSVYVASASTVNPNNLFSGQTWSLFDKEYSPQWISSGFTFNTTNTQDGTFGASLSGHSIEFRLTWKNKVAASDSALVIGTFNDSAVGITTARHNAYPIGFCDDLNAIITTTLTWSSGVGTITATDWITRATTIPTTTGKACDMTFTYQVGETNMLNSFCNKFYWKRTA